MNQIVVSGPPVPDARTKLPAAFKQRFNIDMDYLAVNSSQLASRNLPTALAGGYGIVSLWNQAPHPNAAKVFVNWIASKDGVSVYGAIDQSAPVRTDVDASAWVPQHLIPKPGKDYFDTFEYKYVMEKRQPIARFYAALKS
jgi:ABC-type glycerol-3-phosphate transport system substrate-binding protein